MGACCSQDSTTDMEVGCGILAVSAIVAALCGSQAKPNPTQPMAQHQYNTPQPFINNQQYGNHGGNMMQKPVVVKAGLRDLPQGLLDRDSVKQAGQNEAISVTYMKSVNIVMAGGPCFYQGEDTTSFVYDTKDAAWQAGHRHGRDGVYHEFHQRLATFQGPELNSIINQHRSTNNPKQCDICQRLGLVGQYVY